jgi:hypothetical protein
MHISDFIIQFLYLFITNFIILFNGTLNFYFLICVLFP